MIVKVWNDNVHPYKEKFKGQEISIQPKGWIEMDLNEASHFLGTMPSNLEVDAGGTLKPTSYKMLRIDSSGKAPIAEVKKWMCMACNHDMLTKAAYEAHVNELHLDSMVDEDGKDQVQGKKRGPKPKGVTSDASTDRDSGTAKA